MMLKLLIQCGDSKACPGRLWRLFIARVNMGGPTVSFEKNEYHYLFPRVYRCRMIVVIDSKSETNSKNGLNYQINLRDIYIPVNLSYF
jgi:hypothetical protein